MSLSKMPLGMKVGIAGLLCLGVVATGLGLYAIVRISADEHGEANRTSKAITLRRADGSVREIRITDAASGEKSSPSVVSPPVSVDDVRNHAFWKTRPSASKIEEIIDRSLHPGRVSNLRIDEEGIVSDGSPSTREMVQRKNFVFLVIALRPHSRLEALRQLKEALDRAIVNQNYDAKYRSH